MGLRDYQHAVFVNCTMILDNQVTIKYLVNQHRVNIINILIIGNIFNRLSSILSSSLSAIQPQHDEHSRFILHTQLLQGLIHFLCS